MIVIRFLILTYTLTLFSSCTGQGKKSMNTDIEKQSDWLAGDTVSEINGEIRGIFQDTKNNMWFASNENGVFKYDGKTIVNFTEKHGLPSNYVWLVEETKDGLIWFKTNLRPQDADAFCCFDGHAFKTFPSDTNAVKYNFHEGELVFDHYYDGKTFSKIRLPHTSPIQNDLNKKHHYDIYSTCIDRSGNVWFGTPTAGICKYDGQSFVWNDNIELGAAIRDIYEDKNGTLWVGNNGEGLFRYDGKDFILFSREKNVNNPDFEKYPIGKPGLLSRVWKITSDKQGNLWMATIDNGVWKYDGTALTNYTIHDGLGIDNIWTVYIDNKDQLWVGTEGDGVYRFDGKRFKKFKM